MFGNSLKLSDDANLSLFKSSSKYSYELFKADRTNNGIFLTKILIRKAADIESLAVYISYFASTTWQEIQDFRQYMVAGSQNSALCRKHFRPCPNHRKHGRGPCIHSCCFLILWSWQYQRNRDRYLWPTSGEVERVTCGSGKNEMGRTRLHKLCWEP